MSSVTEKAMVPDWSRVNLAALTHPSCRWSTIPRNTPRTQCRPRSRPGRGCKSASATWARWTAVGLSWGWAPKWWRRKRTWGTGSGWARGWTSWASRPDVCHGSPRDGNKSQPRTSWWWQQWAGLEGGRKTKMGKKTIRIELKVNWRHITGQLCDRIKISWLAWNYEREVSSLQHNTTQSILKWSKGDKQSRSQPIGLLIHLQNFEHHDDFA